MRFSRGCFLIAAIIVTILFACMALPPKAYILEEDMDQKLQTEEINLYYEKHGSGDPILFIHGFGASIFSWRYLLPDLSKNYRVMLIDLKGFGKSAKPIDRHYSIYDQAHLVYRFITSHDLKNLIIVGHSFGGGVTLATVLYLIEKEHHRLKKLVLIDSIAYEQSYPKFITIPSTPFIGKVVVSLLSSNIQTKFVLKEAYYEDGKILNEAIYAYSVPLKTRGGKHAIIQTSKQLVSFDISSIITKYAMIEIPTLIIWGKQDTIVPISVGEKLHNAIVNSKMVVIDQCGHIPQEEQPMQTQKIISDFFKEDS